MTKKRKRYAEGTSVTEDRSRLEIEQTLRRYGADAIAIATDDRAGQAEVLFRYEGKFAKLRLALPQADDECFKRDRYGCPLRPDVRQKRAAAERRRVWRCLLLTLKARFESLENDIEPFTTAFLPYLVLPGGSTVGQTALPAIEDALQTGQAPKLLPLFGAGEES